MTARARQSEHKTQRRDQIASDVRRLRTYPKEALVQYIAHIRFFGIAWHILENAAPAEKLREYERLYARQQQLLKKVTPSVRRRVQSGRPTKRDAQLAQRLARIHRRLDRLTPIVNRLCQAFPASSPGRNRRSRK